MSCIGWADSEHGPSNFPLQQSNPTMATVAVDDLLVRLFLRLDAESGPAIILAIFILALWYLLQYNYALFDDLFFQPALHHHSGEGQWQCCGQG
jgi:hypothetical protein